MAKDKELAPSIPRDLFDFMVGYSGVLISDILWRRYIAFRPF